MHVMKQFFFVTEINKIKIVKKRCNNENFFNGQEAYCMELSRLKEGMEQPIKEAASFINAMNIELKELSGPNNAHPADLLCTKK